MFNYTISTGNWGGEYCIGTIPVEVGKYWAKKSFFEQYLFSWDEHRNELPKVPKKHRLLEWYDIDDILHMNCVLFSDFNFFMVSENHNPNNYETFDFKDIDEKELLIDDREHKQAVSSDKYVVYAQSVEKGGFDYACYDTETGDAVDFVTDSKFDIKKVKNVRLTRYDNDNLCLTGFDYEKYSFEPCDSHTTGKEYIATLSFKGQCKWWRS
jgi:hypothetical protein